MKLFGQIVRTVVNVATLPIAAVRDVVVLASDPVRIVDDGDSLVKATLQKLKDEASDD